MASRAGANSRRSLLSIAIATLPIVCLSCRITPLNTYYPNAQTAHEPTDCDRCRPTRATGLRGAGLPAVRRVSCATRPRSADRLSLVLPRARARVQQEVGLLRGPRCDP